ncbi:MAG: ABC transporter permease [Myxococcota bacterium]|nr:ABC transporter permease [Myxococcota bacterium]
MNVSTWLGLILVSTIFIAGIFATSFAPFPEGHRDIDNPLAPPDSMHLLGTTEDGTDILSALFYGARVAVIVGLATVALSVTIGTLIGLISGWYGGWIDQTLMRLIEIFLSFPGFLLALLIIFALGEATILGVILALNVTGWAGYARLVRGQVLSMKHREFVLAARSMGASNARIMRVHLLPNVFGPVTVQATFGIAGAILAEASLSFLGVGPQEVTSWGALLEEGSILFLTAPWLGILSGGCIFLSVLGINLLGDSLRDKLDPNAL